MHAVVFYFTSSGRGGPDLPCAGTHFRGPLATLCMFPPRRRNPFAYKAGNLWMWLQLMWLQFEVVRGPVGVIWGRSGAGFRPKGPQTRPRIDPTRPRPDLGQLQIAAT
jgi:hypothetical protein